MAPINQAERDAISNDFREQLSKYACQVTEIPVLADAEKEIDAVADIVAGMAGPVMTNPQRRRLENMLVKMKREAVRQMASPIQVVQADGNTMAILAVEVEVRVLEI